ncbi:MAG: cyanophycinase [Acidobacteriota bacterium]
MYKRVIEGVRATFRRRHPIADGRGTLVLIGGAEDRSRSGQVMSRLVEIARPKSVAVIPTATSQPSELGREYRNAFVDLGVGEVTVLQVQHPDQADRQENLQAVEEAELIFFTGGNQFKLVEALKGTALLDRVFKKYHEGATIAGTSAGAASAGEFMIANGDNHGLDKGSVRCEKGFGFLEKTVVDTHFVERGRIHRLAQVLSSGIVRRGIGLAEDTAVVVHAGASFDVIGAGFVTVLNSEALSFSNYDQVGDRERLAVDGIRVGFLPPGVSFDLTAWSITS